MCAIAATTGPTAVAVVSSIAPAAASPLDHGHFHDVKSEVVQEFCGDLTVRIDTDVRGSFLVKTQGRDGLVYFLESLHGTVSFTNLATGKSFTNVFNIANKDLKVTDNGDGTLTILATTTGSIQELRDRTATCCSSPRGRAGSRSSSITAAHPPTPTTTCFSMRAVREALHRPERHRGPETSAATST